MEMWKYHDKQMQKLKQIYLKTSKQTQNKIQEIFNSIDFDFNSLYSIANTKTKKRINTYIEEWQDKGLLTGDFGIQAKNIYKRTRVKNSEILELLIYGAYIEEQSKLDEYENQIMYEDANYYYQQGQEEVNKTLKKKKTVSVIPDVIFLALMTMPNAKGYIWKDYIQATAKYNADQIYRQLTIDLQQQKELDITNDIYQNLIRKQQNSRLNINGDKISGDTDLTLIGINNKAKLEGIYSFDDKAEVQFVSIEDEKTTKMCKSLNGQRFKVHDWNEFERYSEYNGRITKYRCYGLIVGLNCPPIDDHFHWCRSFIIYVSSLEKQEKTEYNGLEIPKLIKELAEKQNQVIHERARKYIDRYTTENDYMYDYNYKRIPMLYDPKKDKIIVNPQHDDIEYYMIDETIAHEATHLHDVRNKITENNIDKLRTYINKSKNYIYSDMAYYGRMVADNEENSSLCDLINILSDGRIRNGAFAHDVDYIKNEMNCYRELSSTIISCDLAENKAVNELVKNIKPLKEFKEEIFKLWDVTE